MSGVSGLRVVELSHMVAAPVTGTVLADLGADVVKVEPPSGDAARSFGEIDQAGLSTLFKSVNRGKRSVVLDLTEPAGREALGGLLDEADCLVTNYRPSALARLGLAGDDLRTAHPQLVVALISAYPGDHDDWPGVDINALGLSGLMQTSGWPGTPPVRPALPLADMTTGILAATGILDAVLRRRDTGQGTVLRFALTESVLYLHQALLAHASVTGEEPERLGNGSPFGFTGCFEAADGYVSLAAPSDRLFARLCELIERPDLVRRYPDHATRRAGRAVLEAEVQEATRKRATAHWVALLRDGGVPCARVNTALEALASTEAAGPGFFVTEQGQVACGLPWTVDGVRPRATRPVPRLGEHTAELDP